MVYDGELIPGSDFRKENKIGNKLFFRLVKDPNFPSILIGHKYYVIRSGWIKWIEENKANKTLEKNKAS